MNKLFKKIIKEYITEHIDGYSKWKRDNITIRGIKEMGKDNDVYGSFGKGLYTVPLSNKAMAKQYGELRFVYNGKPKKPLIVDSLNNAEIFRYKLIKSFCEKHNEKYNIKFFNENTTIENEMIALGYDGMIIKGREMVNYSPKNVMYFKTENELKSYYNTLL